jgi:uncharacterized lipoprotein YddW (UPF0748 family)
MMFKRFSLIFSALFVAFAALADTGMFYFQRNDFGYNSFCDTTVESITFSPKSADGSQTAESGYLSSTLTRSDGSTVTVDLSKIDAVVIPHDVNELWTGATSAVNVGAAEPAFADATEGVSYTVKYSVTDKSNVGKLYLYRADGSTSFDVVGQEGYISLPASSVCDTICISRRDAAAIKAEGFIVKGENVTLNGFYNISDKALTGFPAYSVSLASLGVTDASAIHPSLAVTGGYLVVDYGDGSVPVYIDRASGNKVGEIALGDADAKGSVASDDAGNILISNYSDGASTLKIYRTSSVTEAPTLYISYDNKLNLPVGSRIHVRGNLDGFAVITATCDGPYSQHYIRWTVNGGVLNTHAQVIQVNSPSQWSGLSSNAKVVTVGGDYFYSYYSNDTLYSDIAARKLSPQTDAGNFNNAALDARAFSSSRYLALYSVPYFPEWSLQSHLYVYDVTDMTKFTGSVNSSAALMYNADVPSYNTASVGNAGRGDVTVSPSVDGSDLDVYYVDNSTMSLGCTRFRLATSISPDTVIVGKSRLIWIDACANFPDYANSISNIRRDLQKIKDAGFTDIVVDVRPTMGDVLFKTGFVDQVKKLDYWGSSSYSYYYRTATWDYLQAFIDIGHSIGLRVNAAFNTFVGGNLYPYGLGQQGLVFRDSSKKDWVSVVNTSSGAVNEMNLTDYDTKFLNAANDDVQAFILNLLGDLAKYDLDGIFLDRCRFDDFYTDVSATSKAKFETFIGKTISDSDWPSAVSNSAKSVSDISWSGMPTYFKQWMAFRAKTIHDFIVKAHDKVKSVNSKVRLGAYVGAWYSTLSPEVGINWASSSYDPSNDYNNYSYRYWANSDYKNYGYAGNLDFLLIGAYASSGNVYGTDEWSMQGFCTRAANYIKDAVPYAGGPDIGNSSGFENGGQGTAVTNSVDACINASTGGYFVFDLTHVKKFNYWSALKTGIDNYLKTVNQ